jgi:PilZ domain
MKMEARVFREGAVVSLWGCCNEMGEDGMSATLTGELENGEVASLEFTLPMSTAAIKLRAVVRYRSGFRHGFEFLRVSEKQREAIRRALSVAAESE